MPDNKYVRVQVQRRGEDGDGPKKIGPHVVLGLASLVLAGAMCSRFILLGEATNLYNIDVLYALGILAMGAYFFRHHLQPPKH